MVAKALSESFSRFFDSERSGGNLLLACTFLSLAVTNSPVGLDYLGFWQASVGPLSLEHWINDALMAVFFLLIGLELERELYVGELSNLKNALLPIVAAVGGMIAPALIHLSLNVGTETRTGIGIPMATDIAFALGVLAILGNRIPGSLKVFLVAFAIMDDLGAIVIIAVFYTAQLSVSYLFGALAVWAVLLALNRLLRVGSLVPYLLGGVLMWWLMLMSGVHATIAGVMLAFAIPFSARDDDERSPSHRLEHLLDKPVAFVILPIFALANTGIIVGADWIGDLTSTNSLGIVGGLVAGKPLGVILSCYFAVAAGVCRLPDDLGWRHVIGAGILGGIGFTMSIFIANLAFPGSPGTVNASKLAILLASLMAGIFGYLWLRFVSGPGAGNSA
jgi:NhaA family Na+:H+ antiporter